MNKTKGAIIVNEDRCKGCELCIVSCPHGVISLADKKVNASGYRYVEPARPDQCVGCAACAIVCPDGCITVYRGERREERGERTEYRGERKEERERLRLLPFSLTSKKAYLFPLSSFLFDFVDSRLHSAEPSKLSSALIGTRIPLSSRHEVTLMKGNEAIAHACIRCGADGFFGYPITPQSEIIETLSLLKPWETTGMVVLQAESEVAAINMVYGGAGAGKRVLTTSSSPGVALMQEGISYMAGAEIPGVIVNVQRGGPGLGTIQPSQSDYFQATRGGGNGDYNVIVLAPSSVQEMADFVDLAFTLAFRYRNPAMILSDGVIGQMMERVVLPPFKPRRTEQEIAEECPWATIGRKNNREPNIMTSLELKPEVMEQRNIALQEKYAEIRRREVRYETLQCEDAEYLIVAFGSAARIAEKSIEIARSRGIKAGLFRPITLWPFPSEAIAQMAGRVKGILVAEINAGQMIEDVRLAVEGKVPVKHFGRLGGIVPEPEEIVRCLNSLTPTPSPRRGE